MSTDELPDSIISDQLPILQITENGLIGMEILCRICGNRSENLIPIYSEEGISNDLAHKINLYLPVKITEEDLLPLQCCFQCASTILTWHELFVASVEAEKRLKELQEEAEKTYKIETPESGDIEAKEDETKMETTYVIQERMNSDDSSTSKPKPEQTKPRILKRRTRQNRSRKSIELKNNETVDTTDGEWIKAELIFNSQLDETNKNNLEIIKNGLDDNAIDDDDDDDDEDTINFKNPASPDDDSLINAEETSEDKPERKLKREFHCDFCTTIKRSNKELKKHILDEHPDKLDQIITLKQQKKRSKIDQEAVNKAKIVVNSRTYYHCNECGKNLHSPYTYIWHNRIHTGERPFVCDLCGKQFRVSQGLVRHLRETHAGIKNFPCDLCGRMFASRRNVEEHRRIHTNERPYICDLCGKSFKQKASLFVHNRSHTDTFPFRCSYCSQGFRTKTSLLVHVTRHTGEKPYACEFCGRCFRIKYELKRHRLIHSDEKPFSCTECGLSFRQKRYLRNHNKINHNRLTP